MSNSLSGVTMVVHTRPKISDVFILSIHPSQSPFFEYMICYLKTSHDKHSRNNVYLTLGDNQS